MVLKPQTAKILDFETSFEAQPVPSPEGEVVWAEVRIDYILAGFSPTVTIRVPVPWDASESPEIRKSKALRCARQLIDHACQASGVPTPEPAVPTLQDKVEAIVPAALEGVAQELGLTTPTTRPKKPARV